MARLLGWHWRLRFAACAGGALRVGGAAGVSGGGPIRGAAGHQQAEVLLGDGGRAERDDPAFVHDGDTVGQGVDLVEFGGDDHHRHALVPLGDQAFVHELDRADIQAAGRLADDHQFDVPLISRATTTFCWLPPDSVPAGVAVDWVRTSYSSTRLTADSLIASRFSAIPEAYGGWS